MSKLLVATVMAFIAGAGQSAEIASAPDAAQRDRMMAITSELRCLVCQNQTIADSHAALAVDLRNQVTEKLQAGFSDQQILDYMTARYGDFVLYRPPLKSTTAILWFGPGVLLVAGIAALALVLRRRSRLPAEAFEADQDGAQDDPITPHS